MKKRWIGIFGAAILLFGLTAGAGADEAEKKIVFTPSVTEVSAEDTFTVTLSLEGFENYDQVLVYDPVYNEDCFEWTGGEWLLPEIFLSDYITESVTADGNEQGRSIVCMTDTPVGSGDAAAFEFRVLRKPDGPETISFSVIVKSGTAELTGDVSVSAAEILPAAYEFEQDAQIRLLEPWGLEVSAGVTNADVDYASVWDYGVYFIRGSKLDAEVTAPEMLTAEDIAGDADAVKYTKTGSGNLSVTENGGTCAMTAVYDRELSIDTFSDPVYAVFYITKNDSAEPVWSPVCEWNLSRMTNERKDDASGTYTAEEKAVYAAMAQLEQDIAAYRADFENTADSAKKEIPTLGEYTIEGVRTDRQKYEFGHTVQIRMSEPWGMKLNGRVKSAVDYASLKEYGVIVCSADVRTAEELLQRKDARVFSSKNGGASVTSLNGSEWITAEYSGELAAYELDTPVSVMYYLTDAGGTLHCGPVKVRKLTELLASAAGDTTGRYSETEKAVYRSMTALYTSVTAYRLQSGN